MRQVAAGNTLERVQIALLVTLLTCSFARSSHAANGFSLERFTPTAPGETSFWVDKPYYNDGAGFLTVGLTFDYAHNPLVSQIVQANGALTPPRAIIANEGVAHVEAAATFIDRITASVALPVVLFQSGQTLLGIAPLSHPAISDPRLGGMVRLWNHSRTDHWSLHAGALLWIPLNGSNLESDGLPRFQPKVLISGAINSHFLYSASLAFLLRQNASIGTLAATAGNTAGSEVQLAASISWTDEPLRLTVGPEAVLTTVVTAGHAFQRDASSLEILAGIHYRPLKCLQASLGAGAGLYRQPGTPDARVIARVAYTTPFNPFERYDTDGDGVFDDQDACPTQPSGKAPDPNRLGCPSLLQDTDGDGVLDGVDECPTIPRGAHEDPKHRGCPPSDMDSDGVADDDDHCPIEPAGALPDPNNRGCPLADADHDGVPDREDLCPTRAAGALPSSTERGCPGPVRLEGNHFVTEPLRFAKDDDTIERVSVPILLELVKILQEHPSVQRLSIEGHTDNKGDSARNLALSTRRARAVMNLLIKGGVAPERLEYHGFGDTKPIATNDTEAGRTLNRRVDFRILR